MSVLCRPSRWSLPTDLPKIGDGVRIRPNDYHGYVVQELIGSGGYGKVFSAVRTDGAKVSSSPYKIIRRPAESFGNSCPSCEFVSDVAWSGLE